MFQHKAEKGGKENSLIPMTDFLFHASPVRLLHRWTWRYLISNCRVALKHKEGTRERAFNVEASLARRISEHFEVSAVFSPVHVPHGPNLVSTFEISLGLAGVNEPARTFTEGARARSLLTSAVARAHGTRVRGPVEGDLYFAFFFPSIATSIRLICYAIRLQRYSQGKSNLGNWRLRELNIGVLLLTSKFVAIFIAVIE